MRKKWRSQFDEEIFSSNIPSHFRLGNMRERGNFSWINIDAPEEELVKWCESQNWRNEKITEYESNGWLRPLLEDSNINKGNILKSYRKIIYDTDIAGIIVIGTSDAGMVEFIVFLYRP